MCPYSDYDLIINNIGAWTTGMLKGKSAIFDIELTFFYFFGK